MQHEERVMGVSEDGVCGCANSGLNVWEGKLCCQCWVEREVEPPCSPNVVLSGEAWDAVVSALEHPPEPTDALRALMRRGP